MATVYIDQVPYGCQESDLERFFRGYGRIQNIFIKQTGSAFVEFRDYEDADDAIYELNGRTLMGKRLVLDYARGPSSYGRGGDLYGPRKRNNWLDKYGPPTRTEYRLIVENLSSRVSWQDLKDYMRQAGEVTYADAHKQRRNEGIIEFATYSDMKSALNKLNGTELNGRTIKLIEDRPHHSRRSRSRSYSRSRSRSRDSRGGCSRSRSPRYSRRRKTPSKSRSRSASHSGSPRRSLSQENDVKKSRSKSRSLSKSPAKLYEGSHSPFESPRTYTQEDNE